MLVRPAAPRAGRISLLFAATLVLAACVPTGTTSNASPTPSLAPTAPPPANPYTGGGAAAGSGTGMKIGYISYGEQVDYVKQVSSGIRDQVKASGADLVECDAALDPGKIPGCLKQMADAGVKGLIQFQPVLADTTQACVGLPAGLKVVAIEEPTCQATLVREDDLRAGQIAGEKVGDWVRAKWSCTYDAYVSLESATAAGRNQLRMEGYWQGFMSQCPTTNEASRNIRAADTLDTGTSVINDVLGSLPGKSRIIVVAINDSAALGALQGAKAAGRTADVWISGQGADAAARADIRTNPQWIGDSAYFPERYGATAVPALLDLIAGKTVPTELLISPQWVDASNIGSIYPN